MASNSSDKDAQVKARILVHMNAGHRDSLAYYLRHYAGLSPSAARYPVLTDMTFEALTIQSKDGKSHKIPIEPPLTTWAEARPRVITMDQASRRALSISPISVTSTSYLPPTEPIHVLVFFLCLYLYVSLICQAFGLLHKGSFLYNHVLTWFPLGAEAYLWIQKMIWIPVLFIHLGEATWMASKLRGFGLDWAGEGNSLWWKWVVSAAVEGYGAHQRFGSVVRRKEREELEAAKRAH